MDRMIQNFRRWSGNMLRNGSRAIALGPRKVTPFIWWCVVDQRIAMWTMLVSPIIAVLAGFVDPVFFWSSIMWVVFSRTVLCLFLFTHSRTVDLSWPYVLYLNQVINASVKVYVIFHLSKQKWANRGNQSAGDSMLRTEIIQNRIAKAQLITTVTAFVTVLAIYVGLLPMPSL